MKKAHLFEVFDMLMGPASCIKKFPCVLIRVMLFSTILMSIACSDGPPAHFMQQKYQEFLDRNWPGSCKVIEYKLLNTFKRSGSDTVDTKYYVKVEILNDLTNRGFGAGGTHLCGLSGIRFLNPTTMQCPDFSQNPFLAWNPDNYKIKKGYIFERTGNGSWTKTVNGWE